VVQRFASAFGGNDSYVQIILNLDLPDEITKVPGSEAGIKLAVLSAGFTRYNALYFNFTPLGSYLVSSFHKGELVV